MGQLILGDPRPPRRYTIVEIALATGICRGTLNSRRMRLEIPFCRDGYTYEDVLRLIKKPTPRTREASRQRAEELRRELVRNGVI